VDLDDEQIQQWMSSTELPLSQYPASPLSRGGGRRPEGFEENSKDGEIKGRVIVTCH